ncbi:MAG: hypothetical protein ABFS34_15205 [Gemmatimonadota bacterium]
MESRPDRRDYRLGRLGVSVSGTDPILPYLTQELRPLRVDRLATRHLDIEFASPLPALREYTLLSPLAVARDEYIARHGGLEYHVSGEPPAIRVRIRSRSRFSAERRVPHWMLRAGNSNYLLPSEKVTKNFMYNVFDHLTQIAGLALGQSYVHASSFERDGRAVAVVAWGGVGKTSSMLKLVTESGWRFLSDDLALVDDEGVLWRTPKRLQVYAYNVEGQPELCGALMRGRSPVDRANWRLRARMLGPDRVRRRVSAEQLLGPDRVAKQGRLSEALFMERADVAQVTCSPLDTEGLVRRAAATLLRETQPMADLVAAMHSGGWTPVLPGIERFMEDTRAVLRRGFDGVPAHLVRVPLDAGPDQLADFLTEFLDADRAAFEVSP